MPHLSTRHFLLGVAAASVLVACGGAGDRRPAGDSAESPQAPEYSAVSLQGDSVSLASFRGDVVLLNLWATWCPPCREEMPLLQQLQNQHTSRGFHVIGVSIDAAGEETRIRRFLDEHHITFSIWLDPDDRASFVFRAIGVPATYLIDRDGRISWRMLGPLSAKDTTFNNTLERALSQGARGGTG
jgi:cytochrome c-type biogenesis protein